MHAVHAREGLESFLRAGLDAVDGGRVVRDRLRIESGILHVGTRALPRDLPLAILAVGKAAGAMAEAAREICGDEISASLVVTKDGHAQGRRLTCFEILETGHPIPDARSDEAGRRAIEFVSGLPADAALLVLLSGGASSLLSAPIPPLSLEDLAEVNRLLLESGAEIEELNCVRKHLSLTAGGRLGMAATACRIEVLAISDVPGDREDVIGSGPFSPDPSHFRDALAVLEERVVASQIPEPARRVLEEGAAGASAETPEPGDPRLDHIHYQVIASNREALAAAAAAARQAGFAVEISQHALRGEAREVGRELARQALRGRDTRPVCLLAGGETSVVVRGAGQGGRNQELALAAAIELARGERGEARIGLLAVGSDGTDGPTPAAGAYVDAGTVGRAAALGVSAEESLDANDSYAFFAAEGGAVVTGPTGTNVMDLVLIGVDPLD